MSAFLIITPPDDPGKVLLGRPDPRGSWESMATLEPARVATIGDRWILPASHLLEFESPLEAAKRIAREQLELGELRLRGPELFSEAYPSALDPESGTHWDLDLVFRGEARADRLLRPRPWREVAFLDPLTLSRNAIARGHADILSLTGFHLKD